jgi:hypothetical protein
VLDRDPAHLGFGLRVERIRQDVQAEAGPARVRGHRVTERFELRSYDGDRRLPLGRHGNGVVNGPRGAAASIAEADERGVDIGGEHTECRERFLTVDADAVAGLPSHDARAGLA